VLTNEPLPCERCPDRDVRTTALTMKGLGMVSNFGIREDVETQSYHPTVATTISGDWRCRSRVCLAGTRDAP